MSTRKLELTYVDTGDLAFYVFYFKSAKYSFTIIRRAPIFTNFVVQQKNYLFVEVKIWHAFVDPWSTNLYTMELCLFQNQRKLMSLEYWWNHSTLMVRKWKNVFALCIKGLGHWLLNMIVINDSVNNTDECTKAW